MRGAEKGCAERLYALVVFAGQKEYRITAREGELYWRLLDPNLRLPCSYSGFSAVLLEK
jgi:hypothetical protein